MLKYILVAEKIIMEDVWAGKEIPAISEWIMYFAKAPLEEYRKLTEGFTGSEFNAEKYVDLAVRTGMKYIVVTSKYHEGFSPYDTEY